MLKIILYVCCNNNKTYYYYLGFIKNIKHKIPNSQTVFLKNFIIINHKKIKIDMINFKNNQHVNIKT